MADWQTIPGTTKPRKAAPIDERDLVTLAVGDQAYEGWKSVRIEAGIERAARSFEVEVTLEWPDSGGVAHPIKPGDLVEVRIGGDLMCTGYVDARPVEYDASGINVRIIGRSKTGDLVDSSADNSGGQFTGQTAPQIIEKLAGQYGIKIVGQGAAGDTIKEHQIQQGESVFESMDRVAQARQILITDDANGNLVLAAPGSAGKASSALQVGVNILSGVCGFDYSEVYGEYIVKGAQSGSNDLFGSALASEGRAQDHTILRRRTLILRQQGQADARTVGDRAAYEAKLRGAKAQEARYTVAGWRQEDGSLWRHNQTVRIVDPIIGINAEWVITATNYTLDLRGQITELVVLPLDAITAMAQIRAEESQSATTPSGGGLDWSKAGQ